MVRQQVIGTEGERPQVARVRLAEVKRSGGPGIEDHRAGRRAAGQLRRYAVSNRLGRLLTLTCADQTHERRVILARAQAFLRRLNASRPDLAWEYTIERHLSGALHVHVGIGSDGRKLDRRWLARTWGHGFIDIRKIKSRRPGAREAARSVARYVAKYALKDPVAGVGEHRYEVRQGYQPRALRSAAWSEREGLAELVAAMGSPAYTWDSQEAGGVWNGPPVLFLSW